MKCFYLLLYSQLCSNIRNAEQFKCDRTKAFQGMQDVILKKSGLGPNLKNLSRGSNMVGSTCSIFQDLSRCLIETGFWRFERRLKLIKFGHCSMQYAAIKSSISVKVGKYHRFYWLMLFSENFLHNFCSMNPQITVKKITYCQSLIV